MNTNGKALLIILQRLALFAAKQTVSLLQDRLNLIRRIYHKLRRKSLLRLEKTAQFAVPLLQDLILSIAGHTTVAKADAPTRQNGHRLVGVRFVNSTVVVIRNAPLNAIPGVTFVLHTRIDKQKLNLENIRNFISNQAATGCRQDLCAKLFAGAG